MPTTNPTLDALRRLGVATLSHALGVAIAAAVVLPTILTPLPVAALLPEPPPVVARTSPTAPALEAAP